MILLLAMLLGANPLAQAALPSCPPAPKAQECADNLVYATVAKACLERYDAAIESAQKKVAEALQAGIAGGAQAKQLGDAKGSYSQAVNALKELAAHGKLLEKQVLAYKKQVVWPDDFGPAVMAGVPAASALAEHGCYSDTQGLVKKFGGLIALSAEQLSLTAEISAELAKKAGRGEGGLKQEDLAPLLEAVSQGQGEAKAPVQRAKVRASDITGTKNKK